MSAKTNRNDQKKKAALGILAVAVLIAIFLFVSRFENGKLVHRAQPKVLGASTYCGSDLGNSAICPKPTGVALPPAGQSFVDPTFGSQIIRLTDANTAPSGISLNSSPSDSSFNSDGSLFYVIYNNDAAHLFSLDRANNIASDLGKLPNDINFDGAHWDANNPNVLYTVYDVNPSKDILQLTITSRKPLKIQRNSLFGFSNIVTPNVSLSNRVQASNDNRYFALMGNSDPDDFDDFDTVLFWDKQTYKSSIFAISDLTNGYRIDSIDLDQSGNYIVLEGSSRYGSTIDSVWFVLKTSDGTVSQPISDTDDFYSTSMAMGSKDMMNIYRSSLVYRTLDNPKSPYSILDLPAKGDKDDPYQSYDKSKVYAANSANPYFFQGSYVSNAVSSDILAAGNPYNGNIFKIPNYLKLVNDDGADVPEIFRYEGTDYTKISGIPNSPGQWSYDQPSDTLYVWPTDDYRVMVNNQISVFDWRPMMEEIVQFINVNGNWTWRRLAHHHMQFDGNPSTTPHANPDPTGNYVLFASNWDGTQKNLDRSSRNDAFLLVVPPLPTPAKISGINVSDIKTDSATITWTTDKPTDTYLEYGLNDSYGDDETGDPILTTKHKINLNDIFSDSTYHFRIKATDLNGITATSDDQIFDTPPDEEQ